MAEEKKIPKKRRIILAVLLTLVFVSAGALVARVIYLNLFVEKQSTVVVPDNLIGDKPSVSSVSSAASEVGAVTSTDAGSKIDNGNKKDAAAIALYTGKPADNKRFQVENMLPGDTETRYFAVKLSHSADVTVRFSAQVTEQAKALADVLQIKITHLENGKVLYEGAFSKLSAEGYGEVFTTAKKTETIAYYKIEVSLPTSVGNAYQSAGLMADFQWQAKDTDALEPPRTGVGGEMLLWCILFGCIFLLFTKRREMEVGRHAAGK